MISLRRLIANRQNAALSTGPRTGAGKRKASRNALRHGLAASLSHVDLENQSISELTAALAPTINPFAIGAVGRVVRAQRAIRQARLARAFLQYEVMERCRRPDVRQESTAASALRSVELDWNSFAGLALRRLMRRLDRAVLLQHEKRSERMSQLIGALVQLDRYERRATSRRHQALRELAFATTSIQLK